MSYNIVVTTGFKKSTKPLVKKYRSLKADILQLVQSLEANPFQGQSLGKDCYKIRLAITSKRKGKSGGARVISCVKVINETVYLLALYDKSDRETLSDKEIDFLVELAGL